MNPLRCPGRGRGYTPLRAIEEHALRAIYQRGWPARLWARVPGSTRVQLRTWRLPLLPPGTPPLRLGFASDLHIGPTTPRATLERAFALLADATPDVLLLGGDYVFLDATPRRVARLRALIARVPTPLRFAVLGNHDLWSEHPLIEEALGAAGVNLLTNAATTLPPPWERVTLVGLDDPWTGEPRLPPTDPTTLRVGLAHAPEILPHAPGLDLLLVGHTHGGQIALPGGHPIVAPGALSRRYVHGLHQVDGTRVITSRGLGGVETAARLFAPPDVVIVDSEPMER